MITDHLPIFKLRLRTERLELRLPDYDELGRLADVAVDGVHEPGFMPFLFPWRWRLGREDWEAHRRHEVSVEGLDEDVLDMLGLGSEPGPKAP